MRLLRQWGGLPPGMSTFFMLPRFALGLRQVKNGGRPPVPGSPQASESGA
jgi:hypothetical protein